MKQNEGSWDRIVRVVLGLVFVAYGFLSLGGVWGSVLGIVGLVALVTGAVGFCPLYSLVRISTRKQ